MNETYPELLMQLSSMINKVKTIAIEMKHDESVKDELSDVFQFYLECRRQERVPVQILSKLDELYNTVLSTVQFLKNCKDLGW